MFKRLTASPDASDKSDVDLHRASLHGSGEAMAELYRRYGPLIYRFTVRMSQNTTLAEEITQETFLALLEHTDRFDPSRGSLPTWLCSIARHHLLKHFERHKHYPIEDYEDGFFDPPTTDDSPDRYLARKEAAIAVRQGIDTLPLPLKEVLLLCEFEELPYQEVSMILAIPVGTVRSRLHRAKLRLQSLLRPVVIATGKETPR